MKVSTETTTSDPQTAVSVAVQIPDGLIGFPEHKRFQLACIPDQLPFLYLNLEGPMPLQFVVIEPNGIIPNYELELFDKDAEFLGIADPSDAIVLNIVTVRHGPQPTATVNLSGPIVINRRSSIARQCILANYSRYSTHHPLVESAATAN